MKNLQTFDQFLNESVLNEATKVDKVRDVARKYIDELEIEFKIEVEQSQIMKVKGGFEIRVAVSKLEDKVDDWNEAYKKDHKNDLPGISLYYTISEVIPGRKVFWPADNKMYFDIELED